MPPCLGPLSLGQQLRLLCGLSRFRRTCRFVGAAVLAMLVVSPSRVALPPEPTHYAAVVPYVRALETVAELRTLLFERDGR